MQQIIVYRNPAEAAFWDLMTSSPNMFPISVGIVVFFVFLLVFSDVTRKSKYRGVRNVANSYVPLAIAAVVGVLVTWYMWI